MTTPSLPLAGHRALVTGGASGLGLAAARALRAAGAAVAVLDRAVEGVDPDLLAVRADVTDTAAVQAAVTQAVETLGGLDILVNNAGIGAQGTVESNPEDSATKGGVSALTRAMAADLLPEGIRVNAVDPGTADTPWIGRLLASATDPEAERAALEARQPHGRLVSAEEVAAAVLYLASPAAGSTTGTELAVDGGMSGLRLRPRS